MRLDANIMIEAARMREAGSIAKAAEAIGFDTLWTSETKHNGFLPLVLAAEHTERIRIGTAVAIAFPRSPMVMAQIAWDLQALSKGRFILGLGTQVKAHIERRYATAWEAPVAKLRDYILAMRAIWANWQGQAKLDYQGNYYQISLMTPFFNPGPIADPHIPIYIAGVNEGLARLAGELCQGFHVHPFHSVAYLNRVVRPQIAAGAAKAGRDLADIKLVSSVFLITGPDERTRAGMRQFAREQIAFYASTPTYRVVLETHGWAEVGEQLSHLAAAKRWAEMGSLISDEMLAAFAVEAPLDQIGHALRQRYDGVLDHVCAYMPYAPSDLDPKWCAAAQAIAAE
jgi:probable F420-dependent oxidoreductase